MQNQPAIGLQIDTKTNFNNIDPKIFKQTPS